MRLFDALTAPKTSTLHAWDGDDFRSSPWDDAVRDAERIAAGLRAAGVEPGTPVATVLTNSPWAVRGMLGVWLAGGAVASLPVPARGMTFEEYVEQVTAIRRSLESPLLVTEQRLVDALGASGADVGAPVVGWESLPAAGGIDGSPPGEEEIAFIQYSSGSTSAPKGCMLTTRAIGRHMDTIGEICDPERGDVVGSWLPLSHDMGVFGCLLFAWTHDLDLALSSPERFIAVPRTWFGDWADFQVTLSAGPPSALRIAERSARRGRLSRDLRMRTCVLGAERIDWHTVQATSEALAPYGFDPAVWMPAYGLAEATLVASCVGIDEAPSRLIVDTLALAEGEVDVAEADDDHTTSIVSVGRPPRDVEIRFPVEGRLAEIHLRTPSLFSGYFGDPDTTAERLVGDELVTGDLGFERDGSLYIVGRQDDVLSIGGRNVYAREIEAAVDLLDGVRSGCSTIVDAGDGGNGGAQRLVMLLELRDEAVDTGELAGAAARTATAKAGVPLDECVFLPKGSLPKTPSGKIQRFRCRQLVLADRLEPIARVEL